LTHGHADAVLGLDDLRSFSNRQIEPIPVYASKETLDYVESAFPYLIDRSKATGKISVCQVDIDIKIELI
jgi:phosphoribosyl 1,2-cyclic phosphodiesterase